MKKFLSLFFVCLLLLNAMNGIYAIGENEHYYTNEFDNYHYVDVVLHPSSTSLPSKYDSRDYQYVTSVKNQGVYDTHWLHAFIGASEANIIKRKFATKDTLDLSELAAGYMVYHPHSNELQLNNNDTSTSQMFDFLDGGGNLEEASFMLSRGGIVDESLVPYTLAGNNQEATYYLNSNIMLWTKYRLEDAIFIPKADEEAIKEAIIKYGAVAFKYQSCRINDPKHTYVYRSGGTLNSALTIIGYDDTISKDLFYGEKPSRDGAWIVKNSWGNTANGGIFYLSYDHLIDDAIALKYGEKDSYDYLYHYDGTPSSAMKASQVGAPIKAANIYQVQKGAQNQFEYLTKVGIGIGSVNTNYEIQIYTNLKDQSNPESGTPVFNETIKGSKNHPGYYTIPLPVAILLEKDTYFSVVVTLQNRNQRHITYLYTSSDTPFGDVISFHEGTEMNQSFVYENNKWSDLHQQNKTARIRACTSTDVKTQPQTMLQKDWFQLSSKEYTYTGSAIEPEIQCFNDDLLEGRDYIITYKNHILSGEAMVIIQGIHQYEGKIEYPFTIQKRNIMLSMIEPIEDIVANGTILKPQERVIFGNRILQKDLDYEVTYGENLSGIGTITITGKDQFQGSATQTFTIKEPDAICTFSVNVEPSHVGSASIRSEAFVGDQMNVITSPYSDEYTFIYWKENDQILSRENPYTFIAQRNMNLTAYYRETKDYQALQALYVELKDTPNENYNAEKWNQFQEDLNLVADLINRYQVNDIRISSSYYWLLDSYEALSKIEELNYQEAISYVEYLESLQLKQAEYTSSSWSNYSLTRLKLVMLLSQQNATSQEEINNALTLVQNSYSQLQKRANKERLLQWYETYHNLQQEEYTVDSWNQYVHHRENVEKIMNSDDVTQKEVDALVAEVEMLQLKKRIDVIKVQEILLQYKDVDANLYTKESYEIFKEAYVIVEQILEVSENTSLEEGMKKINVLEKAYDALIEIVDEVKNIKIEVVDYKQVNLTWEKVKQADVYLIQKMNQDSTWKTLKETSENIYVHQQKTGVEYQYRVIAKRLGDRLESKPSETVKATTTLSGNPQLQIEKLTFSRFQLSWSKVAGATRYIIYRKKDDEMYRKVLTLGANDLSYETNSLVPGEYAFIVKAARYDSIERVMSRKSNEVKVSANFDRIQVTLKKAGSNSVLIQWNQIDGIQYYEIYRMKGKSGTYQKIKTVKDCEYVSKSLKSNTTYYYKVRGYRVVNDKKIHSAYSSATTYRQK